MLKLFSIEEILRQIISFLMGIFDVRYFKHLLLDKVIAFLLAFMLWDAEKLWIVATADYPCIHTHAVLEFMMHDLACTLPNSIQY